MTWAKPSPALIDLMIESLPGDARIERRRMFGCPVLLVDGRMFAGVCQDQLFARLSPADRAALEAAHGPHPFAPTPGRASKTYVRLPDAVLADEAAVADHLARSLAFAASLAAKPAKAKGAARRV